MTFNNTKTRLVFQANQHYMPLPVWIHLHWPR